MQVQKVQRDILNILVADKLCCLYRKVPQLTYYHCGGAGGGFRCRLICRKVPEIMLLCIKLLIPLFGGYGSDLMQAQRFDVAAGALCARK